MPEPGLIPLGDNFYTGWFYVLFRDQIYSAFKNSGSEEIPRFRMRSSSPFYLLEKDQAYNWQARFRQGPLDSVDIEILNSYPHEEAHPLHQELRSLSLGDFVAETRQFTDNFWAQSKELMDQGRDSQLIDHLTESMMKIAVANDVGLAFSKGALAEIKDKMQVAQISVFPLNEEGCVLAYTSKVGTPLKFRVLPLPQEHRRFFQRYGLHGERPMTRKELKYWYIRLVKTNTTLFEKWED